ncbi:MAG: glycosyltransferase [Desulfovibrionaceae bacterium]|nr:glycosyltransferase [Desulfovibrionaceae bacterium]
MRLSVSIVSHGHGPAVLALLHQLADLQTQRPERVLVTLNVAEPLLESQLSGQAWPFELALIANAAPRGFGANHNQAFARDRQAPAPAAAFAVLNPDIVLRGNPFAALLTALMQGGVGGVYPLQLDARGLPQDHERRLPTPARLGARAWARWAGRGCREVPPGAAPDWVNAAFLVLRGDVYGELGGFDERYRMYCEDVDLCLRLQLAGWRLAGAPGAVVEHAARRASRRDLRHLAWHARSLIRLWNSPAYARYRASPGVAAP